ncbi:MAG: DivIVA domain-containing protein, partial [Micrococcales bacterium]
SAFDLAPGGYLISAVDAALERLDDAFAVQEVKRTLLESGHHELDLQVSRLTVLLQGRIERKAGRRFARLKVWHRGYSHNQVDKLCLRLGQKLGPQDSFDLNELRSAEFKASWGGYAENQVDAFIDRAVELSQIKSVLAN